MEKDGGKDHELEDCISVGLYHQAVEKTYPHSTVEPPKEHESKRTKYYEEKFKEAQKMGFSKRRVAEHLKQILVSGSSDEETDKKLGAITEALLSALDGQIKGGSKGADRKQPIAPPSKEKRADKAD